MLIRQSSSGELLEGNPGDVLVCQGDGDWDAEERVAFVTQAAWFINGTTGNDANDGATATTALRTLAEFSRRMKGAVIFPPSNQTNERQMVVTLAGAFASTDELYLDGILLFDISSLLVQGTVTTTALAATITAVTALGAGGTTAPFTLTTTGLDWTTTAERRIVFPGGQVAWIGRVIDANNVTISNPGITPTNGQVITVQTTTAVPNLLCNVQGQPRQNAQALGTQFRKVFFQDLLIGVPKNNLTTVEIPPLVMVGTARFNLVRCKVVTGLVQAYGITFDTCQLIPSSANVAPRLEFYGYNMSFQNCSVAQNPASTNSHTWQIGQGCVQFWRSVYFEAVGVLLFEPGATIQLNGAAASHIQNSPVDAVRLTTGTLGMQNAGARLSGAGNAAFGINILGGATWGYFGAGDKPSVTGTSGDVSILGLGTLAYAAIPATQIAKFNGMYQFD